MGIRTYLTTLVKMLGILVGLMVLILIASLLINRDLGPIIIIFPLALMAYVGIKYRKKGGTKFIYWLITFVLVVAWVETKSIIFGILVFIFIFANAIGNKHLKYSIEFAREMKTGRSSVDEEIAKAVAEYDKKNKENQ